MRRLIVPALSALILLCVSISTPHGRGLHSILLAPLMIDVLRGASPAATSLRPGSPPVQSSAGARGGAPGAQESVSLEPGKPVERELSGGQSHSYKITMVSGQYLHVEAEQKGIDLAMALFTPDAKKIAEVDSEKAAVESEAVSMISEAPGAYRIEVRPAEKTAKMGRYEIKVEALREATAEDKYRVAAESFYDDTRVRRDVGKSGAKEKTRSADSGETDIVSLQMTRSGRETGVIDGEAGSGRLLSTRREAAAISALVPERERMQALDFEASRTAALRPELGEYRIVHFATHGMLNNIHPELSGIVLSLVDEGGRQQDGFLRLQDIYNLKLPVELVALSACQTGLGKEIKGEGLVGLTRGFMYAGAPRVVASLWKVDDRATSELMKRFYQGMLGGERLRPADALRQAQLSIWKEKRWREPYYWAAFVLQGEWK
jgi:hypothetical protein